MSSIDWERIESAYRAGVLSLREIAIANPGSNHMAIARKAKSCGWTQDLSAKIKAKADDLVTRRSVTESVTAERLVTDRQVIEAGAEAIANVRLSHRGDIRKAKTLSIAMLDELSSQTTDRALFEQLGELLVSPDDKGLDKLNDLYRKVISLPSRVDSVKKLAESLRTLIGLERQAFGIADAAETGGSHEMTIDDLA